MKWFFLISAAALLLALVSAAAFAQQAAAAKKQNPAFENPTDDPKLPRVLLIGDSISIGYTLDVRELLEGKANVHRIRTNGGPTINGTTQIDSWLAGGKWDVIGSVENLHTHENHDVVRQDHQA